MAVEKQVWLDLVMEGFYPDDSFLQASVDMSAEVENNKINVAEAGVDPKVLVDNKTYPIKSATRTDMALELALHTFDTENTIVRNVEKKELSYDKMESVVRQHRKSLQSKCAAFAAYNWAPESNTDNTPVIKTAGKKNASGLKAISFEDILQMQAKMLAMDVDPSSLVAVLSPLHMADLMAEDMKLYREILASGKLFNFQLYQFSRLPYYTISTGVKIAYSASPSDSTDSQGSLFYSKDEVMRADGSLDMFVTYNSPTERGDVIGFQKRFTALPIRKKMQGIIYSDKAI